MKCKFCGAMLADGAYFCPECGNIVGSSENNGNNYSGASNTSTGDNNGSVYTSHNVSAAGNSQINRCPKCGTPAGSGEMYCKACGQRLTETIITNKNKKDNAGLVVGLGVAAGVMLLCSVFAAVMLFGDVLKNGIQSAQAPTPSPTATDVPVTPTPYQQPVFTQVSASSVRSVDYTSGSAVYYPVEYAVDGDYSTCWSSNRNYEITPTLTLSAPTPQHVTGIRLANGYFKSVETYTRNRRITKAEIIYEGGRKIVDMSIDNYRVMQDIPLDAPADTTYIQIHVLETYYGDWKDVCISEVEVY